MNPTIGTFRTNDLLRVYREHPDYPASASISDIVRDLVRAGVTAVRIVTDGPDAGRIVGYRRGRGPFVPVGGRS